MKNKKAMIMKRLESLAFRKSKPYCPKCKTYPQLEVCEKCHSSNMMRELPGHGIGPVSWIIKEFLMESDFEPLTMFNEILDGSNEKLAMGRHIWTPSIMLKFFFPKSYQALFSEFQTAMLMRGMMIKIDSDIYWSDDVLDLLDKHESTKTIN